MKIEKKFKDPVNSLLNHINFNILTTAFFYINFFTYEILINICWRYMDIFLYSSAFKYAQISTLLKEQMTGKMGPALVFK